MYSVWGYIVQGEDRQGQFAPILRAEYKSNRAFVLSEKVVQGSN